MKVHDSCYLDLYVSRCLTHYSGLWSCFVLAQSQCQHRHSLHSCYPHGQAPGIDSALACPSVHSPQPPAPLDTWQQCRASPAQLHSSFPGCSSYQPQSFAFYYQYFWDNGDAAVDDGCCLSRQVATMGRPGHRQQSKRSLPGLPIS